MIRLKTEKEIEIIKESGLILKNTVKNLLSQIRPGITTEIIDKNAEQLIRKYGGEPSFKTVSGYQWCVCVPVNEQIVHTPPSKRILKEGDIITIDIGVLYKGFHTDYAITIPVGICKNAKIKAFLRTGRDVLFKAIGQAKAGNRIGDISAAIEHGIKKEGYFVIRQLTGHGIGRNLHEDPFVPGFLNKQISTTPLIKPGLTLAIEIIYSMGSENMMYEDKERWSIITSDRSLSACFEHTVVVTNHETHIVT
jgi:methionyl aminopeptidase